VGSCQGAWRKTKESRPGACKVRTYCMMFRINVKYMDTTYSMLWANESGGVRVCVRGTCVYREHRLNIIQNQRQCRRFWSDQIVEQGVYSYTQFLFSLIGCFNEEIMEEELGG
jgi:hypothetical protein